MWIIDAALGFRAALWIFVNIFFYNKLVVKTVFPQFQHPYYNFYYGY